MSLSQSLSAAMSGLRATQTSLSIVAANVANADTPGYVRKTPTQVTTRDRRDGNFGSASPASIASSTSTSSGSCRPRPSGGAYADLRADFYDRLQRIYGEPGSDTRARDRLQQLHHGVAGADDHAGFDRRAHLAC